MMSTVIFCLVVLGCLMPAFSYNDHVRYDLKTQARCTEVTRPATRNCIWSAGLNSFADQIAEGGRIVAYKILWFSGSWSGWYVPGVNDFDWKFNTGGRTCSGLPYKANTMRRVWSYFYDHTHKFIICKTK